MKKFFYTYIHIFLAFVVYSIFTYLFLTINELSVLPTEGIEYTSNDKKVLFFFLVIGLTSLIFILYLYISLRKTCKDVLKITAYLDSIKKEKISNKKSPLHSNFL